MFRVDKIKYYALVLQISYCCESTVFAEDSFEYELRSFALRENNLCVMCMKVVQMKPVQ
jgi:hypothetical protein